MRHKYLFGILAVVVLILAIWLVPMALAAAGGTNGQTPPAQSQSQGPSGSQCPFLQAHPWLDPHASGSGAGDYGGGGTSGTSQQINYY